MKKDNVEKEVLELKKKGLTDLAISRKLNVPQKYVYEICNKKLKVEKCNCWIFGFVFLILLLSIGFASTSLNVQLSDQGTGVAYNNGTTLSSGDLTVLVYNNETGGTLIYNETFSNAISNGSWNIMLGSGGTNLPLEYGKVYYKDYLIAGEDASFDGSDRQAFYSPLGDINTTQIIDGTITDADISNTINLTLGQKITFAFGEIIDNIVNGWIRITGGLNVTGNIETPNNVTASYFIGDGSQLTGVNIITESTGLIQGGAVSVNGGDITLIDISAGSGQIVNSTTDPDNPTLTPISWTNITGYNLTTMPDPGDVVAIYLALDSGGNVVERSVLPSPEERRDTIDLGIAARIDNGIIVFAGSGPTNVIHNPGSQVQDLMEAWGAFNIDGNRIQSNGSLQIQKSAGLVFRNGANFQTNGKNPHVVSLSELIPVDPFNYKLGDGTDINLSSIQLDPNNYDDGTSTLATVPNNKWTVQYISVFASNIVEVLYGQELFDTESDAVIALSTIYFTIPIDSKNAVPLAYAVLEQGDISLTDDRFYRISRGGAAGGGGIAYTAGTGLILNGGVGTEFSLNTTYTDDRYINSDGDNITGNLNMTSNNITAVNCITFISGGKICNSP